MEVPAVILDALATLKVDQAELSRRLGVGQPTVSRWLSGVAKPDYESCLRLAQITGKPAADVLRAAGRDPSLLPVGDPNSGSATRAEAIRLKQVIDEIRRLADRSYAPDLGNSKTEENRQPRPARRAYESQSVATMIGRYGFKPQGI